MSGEGCGAEIDSDTEAFSRLESEGSFVRQNGGIPLPEFNFQIAFEDTLAGEPPSLRNFFGGKNLLLSGIDLRLSVQHTNPATAATSLAAAGKFHALLKKQIA